MADKTQEKTKPARSSYVALPVRSRASVSPCPTSKHLPEEQQHKNRKIYNTSGNTHNCKCNDCGATWKMISTPDDWSAEIDALARSFEDSPFTMIDGEDSVVISRKDAIDVANRLRELISIKQ